MCRDPREERGRVTLEGAMTWQICMQCKTHVDETLLDPQPNMPLRSYLLSCLFGITLVRGFKASTIMYNDKYTLPIIAITLLSLSSPSRALSCNLLSPNLSLTLHLLYFSIKPHFSTSFCLKLKKNRIVSSNCILIYV